MRVRVYCNQFILPIVRCKPGPVVQNLMKLLANVTLKFLIWNMADTFNILQKNRGSICNVAFALQKVPTFVQQKYQCIWKYLIS